MSIKKKILVSIVMGSQSDWKTLKHCETILKKLNIVFEKRIVSAHRTPDRLYSYAKDLEKREIEVVIAGAGGAAHLPGMIAALTQITVLGVPVESKVLKGLDSLLSIVQMPAGIPVATVAINGAKNAGLLAIQILSLFYEDLRVKMKKFRQNLHAQVTAKNSKLSSLGADNYMKTL